MEPALFLISFLWYLRSSSSILCYKCDPEQKYFLPFVPTCEKFNASDGDFVRDCPRSTMCFKRLTELDLGSGLIARTVKRGCASQTADDEQAKRGREWYYPNIIYEPYDEGCIDDPNNKDKLTKTLLCYCRGDLCNHHHHLSVVAQTGQSNLGNSAGKIFIAFPSILLRLGIMLMFLFGDYVRNLPVIIS